MANELISVLDDLVTIVEKIHRGHEELEKQLKNLSFRVATIQADMHAAEVKFLESEVGGSEDWKKRHENFLKLKDLVYDVEDLLDRSIFLTSQIQNEDHFVASRLCIRAFHAQTRIDEQGSNRLLARTSSKVWKFLTPFYDILPLRNIRVNEIDELKTRIRSWREEVSDSLGCRIPKSFPERLVFGREADRLGIIDMLCLSDEEIEQDLPVISVVGPGGIGKTTLAQLVACDEKVKEHFDFRMWVPLVDCKVAGFDAERVSKLILKSVSASFDGSNPSQVLQEFVTGKKIFLVLDDVRVDDVDRMLPWIKTLQTGLKKCQILITTRNENVPEKLGTYKTYLVQPLDKTSNWALCKSLATWHGGKDQIWKDRTFSEERIESEIFKKTGGFPLLAKAWGGIFLLEDTKGGWDSILECEIWDASRYGLWQQNPRHNVWEVVLRTLESSYADLPAHLKRCFKSFSLFPKGCWMDKEVLTQLWMAEGFISRDDAEEIETKGDEKRLKENVGKYFDDLLSRTSFFKDIERDDDGDILRCKMYEPLHDIVRYIAKDECSVMTDGTFKGLPLTERTRYSSLHFIEKTEPILSSLNKASKMRAVLCFGNPSCLKVPGEFFTHLKFLRALDLSLPVIEDLPDSVGILKQLRYLNLSYTRIKKLPPFIFDLYLLQTLKLSHSLLDELPKEISKLQKLRHLEIDGTPMDDLPYEIGKLNTLWTLNEFIVGCESSTEVLGDLTLLQGNLIISNMERIASMDDASKANLEGKEGIVSLVLDSKKHLCSQNSDCKRHCSSLLLIRICKEDMVSKDCSDDKGMQKALEVFNGIKPNKNLRRLEIWNYGGMEFPVWLQDKSLENLVSLKLVKCFNVKDLSRLHLSRLDLSRLNLPSLKFLHICETGQIKTIDCCALKGFPNLEKLFLENMPCCEEWNLETVEGESFKELILSNCPLLKALPALPVSLRKLTIHDCPVLYQKKKDDPHAECIGPLPHLEYLVLKGNVGNILRTLCDIPQLESLTIAYFQESSLPSELDQFKALRTLNIHFCPKLSSLPNVLRELTRLQEIRMVGCRLLTEQFHERKGDWSNWSMIDHVPAKEIDNKKFFTPGKFFTPEPTSEKLPGLTSKPALL